MEPNNTNNPITSTESKKKVGPIVVVLAVVLVLIIGALYLFASNINKSPSMDDQAGVVETVKPVTNTADDVNSINADLNSATQGLEQTNF